MERFTISKSEKQTIYEIYRACRICGAGGGYRMPIIQNIVDLEASDVELRQKIQDCLQLEVRPDDRMPPLICELCVDKVNDFYEFLELSRQTNLRTRTRLGLPVQTTKKGESDPGDCILGVTEPLRDSPAPRRSTAGPKCSKNIKKETDTVTVKVETTAPSPVESRSSSVSSRSSRAGRRPPTPPRPARAPARTEAPKATPVIQEKKRVKEKETEQQKGKEVHLRGMGKELQDLLQDNQKHNENSLLVPRLMKRRDVEPPRPVVVPKRLRTTPKEPVREPVKEPTPPPRAKPGPKSRRLAPKEDPKAKPVAPKEDPKAKPVAPKEDPNIPVPLKILKSKSKLAVTPQKQQMEAPMVKISFHCSICDTHLKTSAALTNHLKTHTPTYTKSHHACDPCGKWFPTTEEAASHHRYHRAATFPYHCRRCFEDYKSLPDYDSHIKNGLCTPYDLTPDVKCARCWRPFVTQTLLDGHKCQGYDGRPGGNCSHCSRPYATLKSLKAHQSKCSHKKKSSGDLIADPDVLRRLKPMQVRISRCDGLLARRTAGPYDVSFVRQNYGLDKNYVYPYFRFKPVKPKPLRYNSTTSIKEPERDRYTNWDSEDSDSDNVIKRVDSLTVLCLKKLFSKNMIGKVPRKKRRIKTDAFDGEDFNISSDINDIISSLSDDLRSDGVRKNRKDSLIAIAINDIIGVPSNYMSVGNVTVARSSNSVHSSDKNVNVKDLNDVQIENEGTDTVASASDISTELKLIETEDQNTRNEASESMGDDMGTNDSKTPNDSSSKNDGENVDLNNDEIRNFKSVDGQSNGDKLEECTDSVVEKEHLRNYENTDLNHSEMAIDSSDNHHKSDNVNENNDTETQNSKNENENNKSEMNNDNSEITNSPENNHVKNDSESQITNHESENPCYSEMHNDNGDAENSYNNDNETQNENNEDAQLNNEIDIQTDNLDTKSKDGNDMSNHLETQSENNDGNDMSNHLETQSENKDDMSNHLDAQSENDKTISQDNETNTQNADFNTNHLDTESNDNPEDKEPSLLNEQNSIVNGIHEINVKINHNFEDNEKLDETKKVNKESPIKHSIENLISNTEKNPDKYIDEVISSIEDIINKNPRNDDNNSKDNFASGENSNQMDDQMLMDALDSHIEEAKDKIEDKITLDDLLPKDDRNMDLEDISDDEFNFGV